MKFESDGGTDDSKPEPLAKSAEMKRLVGIAVASGTPIRVAHQDVRKRMRIEARRQKELDEGSFCQSCQTSSCEGKEIA